jgi:hypothetical protein
MVEEEDFLDKRATSSLDPKMHLHRTWQRKSRYDVVDHKFRNPQLFTCRDFVNCNLKTELLAVNTQRLPTGASC